MEITQKNGFVEIVPAEGMMLHKGDTYSDLVCAPSAEGWEEVTKEEYDAWLKEQEEKMKAEMEQGNDEPAVEPETPGVTLEQAQSEMLAKIDAYDNSDAVNQFYIKHGDATIPYWLNRNDRATLRVSANAYLSQGITEYDLPMSTAIVPTTCDKLLAALDKVEVYAGQALTVTQGHRIAVQTMTEPDEVMAYDITADYPEKVTVEL